jgi:flagellin-like protein
LKTRRAISPIIATLLLILIAIAAGVVVYAYVIGFVGSSTSSNGSGAMQLTADQISIKASTGVTTLVLKNIGGGSAVLSNGFYISGSSLAATQLGFRVILTGTGTLSQLQDVQVLYVSSTQVKITVTHCIIP